MNPVVRVGRWSTNHPWRAIALWLSFVAVAVAALALTGTKQIQNDEVGESARGSTILQQNGIRESRFAYGYVHSVTLRATDPAFRAVIVKVSGAMRAGLGTSVTTHVSADGHSALVGGRADGPVDFLSLSTSVRAAGSSQVSAGIEGIDEGRSSGESDLARAEKLSIPVTLLVLLLAFGSLVAAVVPVLLGATAVVAAFGLLGPISQAFPLDSAVKTVVLLIGMAVGVDYALFYVVRSREERDRGLPSHVALERTARTSGRTVVVAGTTVVIAMAAQFAVGSNIFNGLAAGTIAVVACAVAGSVTVLPGLLELLGAKIDRGRIPFLPQLATGRSRFWPWLVERVLRRPLLAAALATGFLLALAAPAVGLQVAKPSSDALSLSRAANAATISAEFPNTCPFNACAPALVAPTFPASRAKQVAEAVARLERLAVARGVAHPPFSVDRGFGQGALSVEMPLQGLGDNKASRHAVEVLRNELIPETLGAVPGVETAVTGFTAQDVDFTHQIEHGIPYVVGFVLLFAFGVLLVAFRSIVVPIKAIVLNLLSVAAAYGVLVLVFQHHWAEGLLGFRSNGAIISWLPLFLFVLLFGLSMDYHIFILSRVREGVDRGLSTEEALRRGIARTAGVVTSAALVMVGVFSLFGTATALDLKEAGIGLAAAILLDATVIRGVLVPASMKLLGEWNWYLPSRLEWLPSVSEVGENGEDAAVVGVRRRQPELGEDVGHVLLDRADG
jgi:RND superfamily putative drug exporter